GGRGRDSRELALELQQELLGHLAAANLEGAAKLYERNEGRLGMEGFYDKVLTPAMHRVGQMWERGEMDVATEHVCTNVAHALVHAVNMRDNGNKAAARVGRRGRRSAGGSVLICTPDGELHGHHQPFRDLF
ncbi:MAG: hypothetical protein C4292_06540, partial [Nitrososphaera sp.]